MNEIENPMVLPKCEYKSNRIPDDVWAEQEDRDYQDKIFEEMIKEENKND